MRLFVIISDVPHKRHDVRGVTAVNIVSWALLEALLGLEHQIVLQIVFGTLRTDPILNQDEQKAIALLKNMGVEVVEPVFPHQYLLTSLNSQAQPARMSLVRRAIRRARTLAPAVPMVRRTIRHARALAPAVPIEERYPAIRARDTIMAAIRTTDADAILTVWSPEGVAATHGIKDIPGFRSRVMWILSQQKLASRTKVSFSIILPQLD